MDPETHIDPESVQAEKEAFGKIVFAFQEYHRNALGEISRWERNYERLPQHHKNLLPGIPGKCGAARKAAHINQIFLLSLLAAFGEGNPAVPNHLDVEAAGQEAAARLGSCSPTDVEKVRYVFKNLVRDWSADGAAERQQCYGRLLDELQQRLSGWTSDAPPRVLIPGAGLARLCVEVAALGYEAQGNEYSYYMLLTAAFILNSTQSAEQWTIHPYLLSTSNNLSDANQLRAVRVPDQHPADMLRSPDLLSMCAGDFVEVYGHPRYAGSFDAVLTCFFLDTSLNVIEDLEEVYRHPRYAGSFDAVLTCFFLDTAHNVIEYLEVIRHVLREGGVWINLGPLLYHWADSHTYLEAEELSLELSLEDVMRIAGRLGFELLRQETVQAPYNADPKSMYQTVYQAAMFTMRKCAAADGATQREAAVQSEATAQPGAADSQLDGTRHTAAAAEEAAQPGTTNQQPDGGPHTVATGEAAAMPGATNPQPDSRPHKRGRPNAQDTQTGERQHNTGHVHEDVDGGALAEDVCAGQHACATGRADFVRPGTNRAHAGATRQAVAERGGTDNVHVDGDAPAAAHADLEGRGTESAQHACD